MSGEKKIIRYIRERQIEGDPHRQNDQGSAEKKGNEMFGNQIEFGTPGGKKVGFKLGPGTY